MPGTRIDYTKRKPTAMDGSTEGKKRPRRSKTNGTILHRGLVQCAQLNPHTSGLPNYEGVSIALASFLYDSQPLSGWLRWLLYRWLRRHWYGRRFWCWRWPRRFWHAHWLYPISFDGEGMRALTVYRQIGVQPRERPLWPGNAA